MATKSKYRRLNSYRKWDWDYGTNAAYFITMVTRDRMRVFGKVGPSGMSHSPAGAIVDALIREIPSQFPYAEILTHVVMPDHLHILIELHKTEADFQADAPLIRTRQPGGLIPNSMKRNDIPRIMRWLKGRCTFGIRVEEPDFSWQRSYYDRIMRSTLEIKRVSAYIADNPAKEWRRMSFLKLAG